MRNYLLAALAVLCLVGPARATEVDLCQGVSSNISGFTPIRNVSGNTSLTYSVSSVPDGGYVQFSIQNLDPVALTPDGGSVVSPLITTAGSGTINFTPASSVVSVGYTFDGGVSGVSPNAITVSETFSYGLGTPGNAPVLPVAYWSGNLPSSCTNGSLVFDMDGGTDAGALLMCSTGKWMPVFSF